MIHLLRTSRRSKGYIIYSGGDGPDIEYETKCCVHCRTHWNFVPGSDKKRGWCSHCFDVTCGRKECDPCVPYMKMIENASSQGNYEKIPL